LTKQVLQETGLSVECTLLWGNQRLDYADFIALCICRNRFDFHEFGAKLTLGVLIYTFRIVQCGYENPETWCQNRSIVFDTYKQQRAKKTPFTFVLNASRSFSATDSRDLVYAFLGLPSARKDDGQLLIEPDYTKTWDQVYLDVAIALLKHPDEAMHVLPFVYHNSQESVQAAVLPSWAPRWDEGVFTPDCRHDMTC
jgi:hypothetical protein